MGNVIQRFGFSISRGWTLLLLIAAALVALSFWIGPLRALPPEMELIAVAADSANGGVTLTGVRATDGTVRFGLPVAMRNVGARPGRPARLSLSVPAQYRISTDRGRLGSDVVAGVPLRRYVIPISSGPVPPGVEIHRIPGLDTLWLEPDLPSYYCTTQGGLVPEFQPAPHYNAQLLSNVQIFYSFSTRESPERNTGVLNVRVDPAMLETTPPPMPPAFRTVFQEPEATVPDVGTLSKSGSRTAYCGDPERPVEIFTVQWLTASGGRLYVVYVEGEPRKHLYDFNADDIIDMETWDADGDGRFEARRDARFRVPEFLLPYAAADWRMLPDTTPADSAFLALFSDTRQGPWRFSPRVRAQVAAARAAFVRDSIARDSALAAAAAAPTDTAPTVAAQPVDPAGAVAPPDPVWLRTFNDTAAGPFRFTRPVVRDTAQREVIDTTPPPPPVRRRNVPLGTPVPYPRRDTMRR